MAHLVMVVMAMAVVILFVAYFLDDRRLSGQHHPSHRRRIQNRGPRDLDRVDDAVGDQVAIAESLRVQPVPGGQLADLVDRDRAVQALSLIHI